MREKEGNDMGSGIGVKESKTNGTTFEKGIYSSVTIIFVTFMHRGTGIFKLQKNDICLLLLPVEFFFLDAFICVWCVFAVFFNIPLFVIVPCTGTFDLVLDWFRWFL